MDALLSGACLAGRLDPSAKHRSSTYTTRILMLTRSRLTLGDAAATAPVSRWSLCADQTTSTTKMHDQRRIDAGKTCLHGHLASNTSSHVSHVSWTPFGAKCPLVRRGGSPWPTLRFRMRTGLCLSQPPRRRWCCVIRPRLVFTPPSHDRQHRQEGSLESQPVPRDSAAPRSTGKHTTVFPR